VSELTAAGVPCGLVLDARAIAEDKHFRGRGMLNPVRVLFGDEPEEIRFPGVVAAHPGITVTDTVATAFVCPFEGPVGAGRLIDVVLACARLGVGRVVLADTLGTASPEAITRSLAAVRDAAPDVELALHLHDPEGQAMRSVDAAIELGVVRFDSAVAGLDGCPAAPGNLSTKSLVSHLHRAGISTGLDPDALDRAREVVHAELGVAAPVRSG